MIPLHDPDLRLHTRPYFIYALVAVNVLVFLYMLPLAHLDKTAFIYRYGLIPLELTGEGAFETIFTSTRSFA